MQDIYCPRFGDALRTNQCTHGDSFDSRPLTFLTKGRHRQFRFLKMSINGDALLWIDLEMDGLDLSKNFILEIACIVTDFGLFDVHEGMITSCHTLQLLRYRSLAGPDLVIHHSQSLLDAMGPWCMEHHTKSGLVREVLESKVTMADAETKIIDFIERTTSPVNGKRRLILAGNSVYTDRYFLEKDMPRLHAMLDPSIVDCSALREFIYRFNPLVLDHAPLKGGNLHRALDDARNSMLELRFYQANAFEERTPSQERQWPQKKDRNQFLLWIALNSSIQCILTDGNLNIIDELSDGKTADELMTLCKRNGITQERMIVPAGMHLGPVRAQLKKIALEFNEFCHYRSADVDVVSVLCEKWFPKTYAKRPVSGEKNDLKQSIDLLHYYRSAIFK